MDKAWATTTPEALLEASTSIYELVDKAITTGTTLSDAVRKRTKPNPKNGEVMQVSAEGLGRALRNPVRAAEKIASLPPRR